MFETMRFKKIQSLIPLSTSTVTYIYIWLLMSCICAAVRVQSQNVITITAYLTQKTFTDISPQYLTCTCTYHLLYPDSTKSGMHIHVNWDKFLEGIFCNPHLWFFLCLRSKQHVLRVPDFGWHLMVNSLCVFMDWYNQPISVDTNVQIETMK